MYYYFTVENNIPPILERYYQTDPSITTLENLGSGNYRVKINPHITLQPGERNEGFVFGLHYENYWPIWDKTNDFSHISTSTYVLNPKVLVVDAFGNVIYGEGMPEETIINVTNSNTSGVTGFIDVHPGTIIREDVDKELLTFCTSPYRDRAELTMGLSVNKILLCPNAKRCHIGHHFYNSQSENYSKLQFSAGFQFGTSIVIEPYKYENLNYPQNLFEQVFTTNIGGVSLALIKVYPFQYNPITDVLTEYTHIDFQFSFTGGSGFNMPDGQ
jgi:hypothetical protein